MKSELLSDQAGPKVHLAVLDSGEEAFSALTRFANEARISAASLTAIGAFETATIGWFDFGSKTYRKIEVNEQCEVLSAIETVLTEVPARLRRRKRADLGIALIDMAGGAARA